MSASPKSGDRGAPSPRPFRPTDSFVEIHDHDLSFSHLATAVHERIVTATGAYGHHVNVANPGSEWVSAVATFKAAN